MKRRNFLGGIGAGAMASRLRAQPGCDCAMMPQLAAPIGAEAFASVGTKVRITNVKVFGVSLTPDSDRPYVFVKIETNQGVVGWGEGTLEGKAAAVIACVHDFRDFLIGADPMQVEHHWQSMYVHSFYRAGPVMGSAISGIDQALWDIRGKCLGQPVYQLLGGAVRDRVRMYTHLGGGDMKAVYETQQAVDPAPMVALAQEVVARGYSAVKVLLTPPTESLSRAAEFAQADRFMRALRDGLGDGIDIMVDCHGRHFPANALEFCRVLAPYRPYFVEEPVPPENVDVMAEVRKASPVPIATGERLVTRFQFREIFEKQACHVIQPDLCHCGGLWEAKKIAAAAETYYMGVAPHNPLGPVANAAALHFALSTPNFLIQEDMLSDVPWRFDVVKHQLKTENGYWLKCDVPGLGVEVDEEAARRHPFAPEVIHATTIRAHDGAVLDW